MTYIIAVAHHAGGVGKTTTALNLGYELARAGQRVLLVDLDPQGDLTGRLGIEPGRSTLAEALLRKRPLVPVPLRWEAGRLALLSSDLETMATLDLGLHSLGQGPERRLRKALSTISAAYDWILLDCPPSLSVLTLNAFHVADALIVPVQAQAKAYRQIAPLLTVLGDTRELRDEGGKPPILGFLLTMADATLQARDVEAKLRTAVYGPMFRTVIPRRTKAADDSQYQAPIAVYAADDPAARAYAALAQEVLAHAQTP